MKKVLISLLVLQLAVCCMILGIIIADKQLLQENIVRLHVVADSNSAEDQALKLKVRDAVLDVVSQKKCETADQAKRFLRENLNAIADAANQVLQNSGSADTAIVTLQRESFPVRHYESFTLPSGVYDSLRVTIGKGNGQNWWCVVFPSFCLSAASEDLESAAAGAGFSRSLTETLQREKGYEISFFLLDCIGKLENIFYFN